jgi:iron(III) transport system substrate-binding protein
MRRGRTLCNPGCAPPETRPLGTRLAAWLGALSICCSGCLTPAANEVVVYAALDEEYSRPILEQFTRETGVVVRAKFDVESTKTVGLVQALFAESARPRCDVFWNNEIVNTLRLERAGLLEPIASPQGAKYPPSFRSPEGRWYGFAARARVLAVNARLVSAEQTPLRLEDLVDPQWKGRVGIAKPLAGTTATHAACLFAAWGRERAEAFFRRLRDNAQILGGNRQVAQAVANGALACGLTDTDDALVEIERGMPVRLVLLDQEEGGLGTLLVPNTLGVIRGAPHPAAARRLVEYLLRPETEALLATGPAGQIPLHPETAASSRATAGSAVRAMDADFEAAAAAWEESAAILRALFAS